MFDFESHYDMLAITPALVITAGSCEDPNCKSAHWRITLDWVFWRLDYSF